MSRIIVKNLPSTITEKKLKNIFEEKGSITDLQLKYTKAGVFRKFAFIGYKTEEDAKAAKDYFNNTFIFTSQVQIELCSNLNEKKKPWKEFLKEKIQSKNVDKDSEGEERKHKKKSKSSKSEVDIPEELKNNSEFKEFLAAHENRTSKPLWADDIGDINTTNDSYTSNDDGYDTTKRSESEHEKSASEEKSHSKKKSKSSKSEVVDISEKQEKMKKKNEVDPKTSDKVKVYNDLYTVKIKHLPYLCKKKHIKQLFHPLKIASLRLPPKSKGFAFVSFKTEKDMNIALNKDKGFLGGRRISVVKYIKKDSVHQNHEEKVRDDKQNNMELLAETGRIFVRNLCYTVTESDIRELFSQYGELAEVYVPIDLLTKQTQGFAFVSYVFAEHAFKAFKGLDGSIFQGRMLHLIPAEPKREIVIDENETNYKKKKEAQLKSQSGSSHNWNILIMDANAVADVIAEKYNVDKSRFLSGGSKESVAVRMALAETQLVMETRKFLIENGVVLDAFSQPAAERSNTVIVVKHLPAKTSAEELNELFSKYGTVSRIILPPSGLAALVVFKDPSEAKLAFNKLIFTCFKDLPLYLQWAPMNSVKEPVSNPDDSGIYETAEKDETKSSRAETQQNEEEPPPGTTIFVKNVNFCTTQERFTKHFEQCGSVHHAAISTKKDIKTGKNLSMGFGFVQYKKKASAAKAIQKLQLSNLDGHTLELKFSNRDTGPSTLTHRKKSEIKKQLSSKILVKNIPFEASEKEVRQLFEEFGILKFVRLPKKFNNEHRGFGFVEYMTKSEAKRAFETLCHSTHLFGRRLVLEWANPDSEDIDEIRKKTARDFIGDGPSKKLKKTKLMEDVTLASVRSRHEE